MRRFWRRPKRILAPTRQFTMVMTRATNYAGSRGTDSLDLLAAVLSIRSAARVIARLKQQPREVTSAAESSHRNPSASPGLTPDAQVVVEVATRRAVARGTAPNAQDLLSALALADCAARDLLNHHGLGADPETGNLIRLS